MDYGTLLSQLGGLNRLVIMISARQFRVDENRSSFSFRYMPSPTTSGRQRTNLVEISLAPDDTYTMKFYNVGRGSVSLVKTVEMVYCDSLVSTFEDVTGLSLRGIR